MSRSRTKEIEREGVGVEGRYVSRSSCVGGNFADVLNFISTAIWVKRRAGQQPPTGDGTRSQAES